MGIRRSRRRGKGKYERFIGVWSKLIEYRLKCTFVTPEGVRQTFEVAEGATLLDIAHANDVDLEGACEGSIACSTCHVILTPEYYDKLEEPSDEEYDMLDLAPQLTETSRLGCQIHMTKELDGIVAQLPGYTRNIQQQNLAKK